MLRECVARAPDWASLVGGNDAVADWIVIVSGYDARALEDLVSGKLALLGLGSAQHDIYRLSYAATPRDLQLNRPLQQQ
jgi:hypothetical protein